MTRLVWGEAVDRRYELGVDHGVLYPLSGPGVVWNGLTAVNETHEKEASEPRYFETIKRGESASPAVFRASLEAFSAPPEFLPALGHKPVQKGFLLTAQPKEQFGLSWRTRINGDAAYKLHILYNVTATPQSRDRGTKSQTVSPSFLSLVLDAVPVRGTNFKPSPHFVVNSLEMPTSKLNALEAILYGTSTEQPRLPTFSELTTLFE